MGVYWVTIHARIEADDAARARKKSVKLAGQVERSSGVFEAWAEDPEEDVRDRDDDGIPF